MGCYNDLKEITLRVVESIACPYYTLDHINCSLIHYVMLW